jgi:L-rhamnose isomerase
MAKVMIFVLVSVVFVGTLAAQSAPLITIEKVMTEEQLQTTGIGTLTPLQRAALDRWLSAYTLSVVQYAQRSSTTSAGSVSGATSYTGGSGGHWIKSKANNGAIVVLEDGSMWEINSLDRIYSALWLPISNVTILKASSPVGEYKYTVVNTDDGEKALAKYLGKQ